MKNHSYNPEKSTSLLTYEWFSKKRDISHLEELTNYANDYDLFIHEHKISWLLSDLFYHYWMEKFIKRFESGQILPFTENEKKYLLDLKKDRLKTFIRTKETMRLNKNEFGKFYLIFNSDHLDYMGWRLKNENDDNADFVIFVIDKNRLSFRRLNDDIDLIDLMGHVGVKDHPSAAGLVDVDLTDSSDPVTKKFFRPH
jgi:hypothetical protein